MRDKSVRWSKFHKRGVSLEMRRGVRMSGSLEVPWQRGPPDPTEIAGSGTTCPSISTQANCDRLAVEVPLAMRSEAEVPIF